MKFKSIIKENIKDKRVFIRADLNVPIFQNRIQDYSRINNIKEVVDYIINNGGKIIIASHMGRPKGKKLNSLSLKSLTEPLSNILNKKITFVPISIGNDVDMAKDHQSHNEIILLENLRFYEEEESNCLDFSKKLALNCDLFVNEAFSCCHREHASIHGITKFLPSFAGPSLINEINSINKIFKNPIRPVAAIVGGSKISTKLPILKNLIKNMDYLIVGGAMANTFLHSQGFNIGKSFYEKDLIDIAKELIKTSKEHKCEIVLPTDVITALKLEENQKVHNLSIKHVSHNHMILDIGTKSISSIKNILKKANTLLWNGPMGAFEINPFEKGTVSLAKFIAKRTMQNSLVSIAGGGDTLSALNLARVSDNITFKSTGGGAFLEMLEGKTLPGLEVLKL